MSDSADKRTVHTDALDFLGTGPLPPEAKRDAIHLAVYPAVADEDLWPGNDVGLGKTGAYRIEGSTQGAVGIVDPFLKNEVKKGERFFIVVYPRQIKSLRHVWEHSAFPPSGEMDTRSVEQPAFAKQVNYLVLESERWLRDFCEKWADCPGYEAVMAEAARHAKGESDTWDDDYLHFNGRDAHGSIPKEFWDHFEIVAGMRVDVDRRAGHFSCSC